MIRIDRICTLMYGYKEYGKTVLRRKCYLQKKTSLCVGFGPKIAVIHTNIEPNKIFPKTAPGRTGSALNSIDLLDTSPPVQDARRTPIFTRRHIYRSIQETLTMLRDLPNYSFTKIQPPSVYSRSSSTPSTNRNFWLNFSRNTDNPADIVEAWHHLAADITGSGSDRAEVLDRFSTRVMYSLETLSYQQLRDVAYSLTLLHTQHSRFSQLANCLDQCLADKLDSRNKDRVPSQEELNEYLEVGYILLRWQLLSAPYRSNISSRDLTGAHNKLLILILLTRHLDVLSPSQVVFSLFLAGVSREYPNLPYESTRTQGFPIPDPLIAKLEIVLPKLTSVEVGIICHGVHQTYLYLTTEHSNVRHLLLQSILEFPEINIMKDQLAISSTAKLLKKRGAFNTSVISEIIKKFEPHLGSLQSYTKLRLLQMCTSARLNASLRNSFIEKLICDIGDLKDLRLKDLEQLTFCLLHLADTTILPPIFLKIQDAMRRCDWSDVRSGRSFVYLTCHLAKGQIYDIASIESIFQKANACDMSDLESDIGLANAIDFLFRLNIPLLTDVGTDAAYILPFLQRNRVLCTNSLFQVLELDFIRQAFNLEMSTSLDPEKRLILIDYFQRDDSRETSHSRVSQSVLQDLNLLMNKSSFYYGFPLPSSTFKSIIIKQSPGPISWSVNNVTMEKNKSELLVLIIPRKSETISDEGEVMGRCKIEMNYLNHLGFKTRILNPPEYYAARRENRNLKYLKRLLKSTEEELKYKI